jgi:predicted nucleotidyltransferase component of viral defense system
MKKEKITSPQGEVNLLERIKKLAITAMFSDDELFDILVLKGGNAMDLVHRLSSRASIDLDFSMSHDFPDGLDAFRIRVERALVNTFRIDGFEAFDIKMTEKPNQVTADMADFWGGYGVEFKLISSTLYEQYRENIDELRKYALQIGQGKKFLIDISRFEYIKQKKEFEFDGYRIFAYTPEMIVCEKLRAICQQMEAYGSVIKRERAGSPRARDFLDIYVLISSLNLNIGSTENFELLKEMFKVKRVPLKLLEEIEIQREFHKTSFPVLRDTVKAGVQIEEFDFYFDYVLQLVAELKPLWNV